MSVDQFSENKFLNASRIKFGAWFALAAYPLGCVVQLVSEDLSTPNTLGSIVTNTSAIAGYMIACSLPSLMMRREDTALDERELSERNTSLSISYWIMAAILLAALMYLIVSYDSSGRLWFPSQSDHWNALFWGAFLYVMVLPVAIITTRHKPLPLSDDI